MKIVISSDLYWPTINGVSASSRSLAIGLSNRGHQVLVLAPSQTGYAYEEIDGNYTIMRLTSVAFPFYHNQTTELPNKKKVARLVEVPRLYYSDGFKISLTPYDEIETILNKFKPDVIHNQNQIMIGQAILRYAKKYGVPAITTNHVMPENLMDNLRLLAPFSKPINSVFKMYGVNLLKKFDYITMPTQAAIDMFWKTEKELKRLKKPIEAVSNGIDLSRFSAGKVDESFYKKYNLPTKTPIITFVGRLDAEKHLPVLIEAFNKIIKKGVKAHLLLVGDGTDIGHLKDLARDYKLSSNTTFTGRIDSEDIVNLHRVSTVFCMPSPVELQSIATLEAMACGKPVVVVDAGAVKELCHDGENGFLCEKDNVDQISESLEKIITDKSLQERFGNESLRIAASHDIGHTLARFEKIYKEVISKKNK